MVYVLLHGAWHARQTAEIVPEKIHRLIYIQCIYPHQPSLYPR